MKIIQPGDFQVHAPKLFNSLPKSLRNKTKCSIDEFKADLDNILEAVPDEPKVSGNYTPGACDVFSAQASNSIIDQIRRTKFGGSSPPFWFLLFFLLATDKRIQSIGFTNVF